jgi:prepilin-type N-terminal cleavage/methylation domain-containing protein
MATDKRGFTLVELLIVVVLGGLVLASTYQVLVANQRTYTVQAAQIRGQQTIRAGVDVLFGELREISAPGGDLLTFGADSLTIRTMRAVGLACDTASVTTPQVTAKRVGRWFAKGDSVFALIDGNPELASDDQWRSLSVTTTDTTVTCASGTEQAQLLTLAGLTGADTILPGAPLRSYERYTYGVFEFDGYPFLGRQAPGGKAQPMVGPLDAKSESPLAFRYLDENGTVTTDALAVTQIEVTLRTRSSVTDSRGDPVQDSVTVRVNVRN